MEPMLLSCERCMAGVRVKLNDDEEGSRSVDMEEREVVAWSNHTGGRVDVSDLLRFRVREGAFRRDDSLKDAMLCDCGEGKGGRCIPELEGIDESD
jgi:hypothetical protein